MIVNKKTAHTKGDNMADLVRTPDGDAVISTKMDMLDLIGKYISEEARQMSEEWFDDFDLDADYAERSFNSDFAAIESENEGYRDELFEVKSDLENIVYKMEQTKSMTIGKKAFGLLYKQLNDTLQRIVNIL